MKNTKNLDKGLTRAVLIVPLEVIPEQMSIEEFAKKWAEANSGVIQIIEDECKIINI